MEINEMQEKNEERVTRRYNAYKRFLMENGVKEELIELPAIKSIIKDVIRNGDFRVVFEGHSPIHYQDPKEDGSFNICGRLQGYTVSVVYEMEFINQDDCYLKLTKKDVRQFLFLFDKEPDPDEEIFIDYNGNIIDTNKNKPKPYVKKKEA